MVTGFRDKGAIFENLLFLKIKHLKPSYVYVDGIELDFMTEDKTLIEVKYNSVLNDKQQKLYNTTKAKQKLVIDSMDSFLKLKLNLL